MSTKLEFHLFPRGRSVTEPDLMPSVKDSDGVTVLFTGSNRKTTEATVVNLGDSPNSNNGDPLRTAFAKINNFIEASYWTNESVNQKFREIDSELMEGIAFYSDSDERYSVSMLGDSKFYFRGTPGQIETNFSRVHGANNTADWDSEVNLKFQLAHTLETFNLNVNEHFNIVDSDGNTRVSYYTEDYPSTYDERPLNGKDAVFNIGTNVVLGRDSDDVIDVKGRIASNLIPYGDEIYNLGDSDNKWRDLYLSGNTIHLGAIQIKNNGNRGLLLLDSDGKTLDLTIASGRADTLTVDSDMVVDGLTRLLGDLNVTQNARFDSDVNILGSLVVKQQMTINGHLNATSSVTFDSDVSISGTVTASGFKSPAAGGMNFDDPVNFNHHVTFDSDITTNGSFISQVTFDNNVNFNDPVNFNHRVTFDSDVEIKGNLVVNDHVELGGHVTMKESLTVDSDVVLSADLRVDSDAIIKGQLTVGEQVRIDDTLYVKGKATLDSDLEVTGGAKFGREVTFEDDVHFLDNAIFDSDVTIKGGLTVNGTTTYVNTNNLEVSDNLIVLNAGSTAPLNDIGFIYTRYDSDNVSAVNWNTTMLWDENQDQFVLGQTSSSGIATNPTITQQYLEVGQTIEFFDSDNATRMIWDKTHATLRLLNKDGSAAFEFDADSGIMSGNGTIEGGSF